MILLGIDTCDSRGSVCALNDTKVLSEETHESLEEYSSWLIPAVERVLNVPGLSLAAVELYAVATGPGSFTGVRVGLTTVKAWAEVYGHASVGVSRLEALASLAQTRRQWIATFVEALRGEVFGGVYELKDGDVSIVGGPWVLRPVDFVGCVSQIVPLGASAWVSPDPELIRAEPAWEKRREAGESIESMPANLAPAIGRLGYQRAMRGRVTNAADLEANYVRRSDAEIFWQAGPLRKSHGR